MLQPRVRLDSTSYAGNAVSEVEDHLEEIDVEQRDMVPLDTDHLTATYDSGQRAEVILDTDHLTATDVSEQREQVLLDSTATATITDEPELPTVALTRRRVTFIALFIVVSLVGLYYLLPQLAGLDQTWHRVKNVSAGWLTLAFLFTLASYGGYVMLFRGVFVRAHSVIRWRESYQITMAGLAATRLFSAGGAGGIVLTAWALRKSGMARRTVAIKTISFIVLTYGVYTLAIVLFGLSMFLGLFDEGHPLAITLLPALIGLVILLLALGIAFVPTDFERRLSGIANKQGSIGQFAQRAAFVPASISAGMRDAYAHLSSRDPALFGVLAYWVFQIGVLWAAFEAFGGSPPIGVLIMAFFVGMLANLLPMPGGIGGVDGGLIGAFAAFGVDAGLAVVSVLVYRAFVFWLPTAPGAIAYFQLRKTMRNWRRTAIENETMSQPKIGSKSESRLSSQARL